jgi:hypothetical protein
MASYHICPLHLLEGFFVHPAQYLAIHDIYQLAHAVETGRVKDNALLFPSLHRNPSPPSVFRALRL